MEGHFFLPSTSTGSPLPLSNSSVFYPFFKNVGKEAVTPYPKKRALKSFVLMLDNTSDF